MSDQADAGPQGSAGSQSGQGSGTQGDWVADLGLEDEQARESLRKTGFKSGADLGKGYLALQSKLGSSVQLPKEGASSEEVAALWERLGRPKSADAYALEAPALPDGMTVDQDFLKNLKMAAHKANLTAGQLKDIYGWYNSYTMGRYTAAKEALAKSRNEATEALKKEMGDKFDKGLKLLPALAAKLNSSKALEAITQAGLGNHPDVVRMLLNAVFAFGEDKLEGGGGPTSGDKHVKGQLDYSTMRSNRRVVE